MPTSDILIVGGGLAGLYCALKLAPRKVTLVAPMALGGGGASAFTQVHVASAIGEGEAPGERARATLEAGAGLCDREIVLGVMREASARIDDLLGLCAPFEKDLELRLARSRNAGLIPRLRADAMGEAMMQALIARVRGTPSIEVLEERTAEELITHHGRVIGAMLRDAEGRREKLAAGATILATGGVGHLFRVTTNGASARGFGLAMAARAGAIIADAEFVQFHPTAIDIDRDPALLASEALREAGATLVNRDGLRFMRAAHPEAELAPRDVIARAVAAERQAGRGAFLDTRQHPGARLMEDFPVLAEVCMAAGVDPALDLIPVCPAQHAHMGGVWTDARGRTSLGGLWAIGEIASTGVHGANRMAGNGVIEAVVFAARVAEDLAARDESQFDIGPVESFLRSRVPPQALMAQPHLVERLRDTMTQQCGVLREAAGLRRALGVIGAIEQEARDPLIKNMCAAALMIAAAALAREESRGGHFRTDFPHADPDQARRSRLTLREARRIASGM